MARFGFSPPTRIFEAAGAGACIITDNWQGIELFLKPGVECIAADSGQDVAKAMDALTVEQARHMGDLAQRRVLTEHTYAQRARQVEQCLLASPRNLARVSCHG
jgi:spore maturation protein CgeB